jgi:hypothetical protein
VAVAYKDLGRINRHILSDFALGDLVPEIGISRMEGTRMAAKPGRLSIRLMRPLGLSSPKVSTFTGLSCHQKGYGLGKTVDTWYATGISPTTPK